MPSPMQGVTTMAVHPDDYEDRAVFDLHTTDERPAYRRRDTDPMLQIVVPRVHDSCPPPSLIPADTGMCPRCKGAGATSRAFETMTAICHVGETQCWVCDGSGLATQSKVNEWIADLESKRRAK